MHDLSCVQPKGRLGHLGLPKAESPGRSSSKTAGGAAEGQCWVPRRVSTWAGRLGPSGALPVG